MVATTKTHFGSYQKLVAKVMYARANGPNMTAVFGGLCVLAIITFIRLPTTKPDLAQPVIPQRSQSLRSASETYENIDERVLFLLQNLTSVEPTTESPTTSTVEAVTNATTEKPPEPLGSYAVRNGIFVPENSYRVSDSAIRFSFYKHRDTPRQLLAKVGDSWINVSAECHDPICIDAFSCPIVTMLAEITLPDGTGDIEEVAIAAEGSQDHFISNVVDARMKNDTKYEHQVGVCLRPLLYYVDWPLLVQFFEWWLALGATKFYVYLHTYSPQVKAVLDFYKNKLGDDLELIAWSDMPTYERVSGMQWEDPNSQIWGNGALSFMHDCGMRARTHVKYIGNCDVDDLPIAAELNISKQLDILEEKHPDMAEVVLDWFLTNQPISWKGKNTPTDLSLDLSELRKLDAETVRQDYRYSKKMFIRPERTHSFMMHRRRRNENNTETGEEYSNVPAFGYDLLYFLHVRHSFREADAANAELNITYDNTLVRQLGERMQYNYQQRIRGTDFANFAMAPWATEAREVMRNIEQCRLQAFGIDLNGMCQQSSAGCYGMIMSKTSFIRAPLSWVDIAHRGSFNVYNHKKENEQKGNETLS